MSNFTDVQVQRMVDVYTGAVNEGADYAMRSKLVAELAAEFGASVPSVRGKLVSKEIYVPKEDTKKGAESPKATKDELVSAIETVFGVELPSFKNVALRDLNAFWEAFIKMSQNVNVENDIKE